MGIASGAARIAAGVIALTAWIGMAVQFDASFAQIGSVAETLWVMLRYFTIIANLIAAILFTGIAAGRPAFGAPGLLGGVTLAMLLVGIVYALLLRGLIALSGGAWIADLLLHSVTTLMVPLFWLILAPKGGLRWRDPWRWAILPVAYFAYALLRGAIEGSYAYPFMNVARIGWPQTIVTALLMGLGFVAGGLLMVWADHRLARRPDA